MAWFTRFTRFGDIHLVYAQEQENSCGIACVNMAVFKINKLRPGRTAVHREQQIYQVYSAVSGETYDGSGYSYSNYLAGTLNRLSVGTWVSRNVGAGRVSRRIVDSCGTVPVGAPPIINVNPILVLVGWGGGGAHWVVVDTVRTIGGAKWATVCDPWDGNVHVTRFQTGQPFNYNAAHVPFSWDLGGTRHEYEGTTSGAADGWVVYRTAS